MPDPAVAVAVAGVVAAVVDGVVITVGVDEAGTKALISNPGKSKWPAFCGKSITANVVVSPS